MRRLVIRGAAVAGLLLGALAACGDDDDSTSTGADATAPDPGSTEPEGATSTEGTLAPPFVDGTYFGYITGTDATIDDRTWVDFDVARIVEGEDAAGYCGEQVDFCIDNEDETVRLVPLADDVEVLDIEYGADDCCDPKPATLDDLLDQSSTPYPAPVDVTIEGSEIVRIEEVYFP